MTLTPSSTRSLMTSIDPPGRHSSAGWKTSRTRPGSRSACWARARPAPRRMVVHVVTAGVADPGDGGAVGHVLLVLQGQRVQVGPEGHRRSVAVADVADQPGAGRQEAGPRPTASRRRATRAVVCRSAFPSSGWAWRWRRRWISSGL